MKAIIVKNNDFKTIGFEVTASARTLFSWGISPCLKSNFQKEVNVDDWMTEIFELVRIQERIREAKSFTREFFDVASKNGILKDGLPICFNENLEKVEMLERTMENIVKNII